MAGRRGSHYGSFAKGFMDSLLAAYKLQMTKDLYDARAQYYRERGDAATQNASNKGALGNVIAQGRADWGSGGGGGGAAVSKNLGANQNEAYTAATQAGLSDPAARALVANMSGEALHDPSNVHWDGTHNAHGIVQWDDQRSAAIAQQFGAPPEKLSVADQTKAAIWEMKTNPNYRQAWNALNSNASPQDMVKTLVTNYERPGNPDKAISQRLQHLGALSSDLGTTTKNNDAGAPTKGPNKGKTQTADIPAAGAQPVEMTSGAGGQFKIPGSGELVPGPNAAPPALGAPLAAPGAQQPNDLGALPRYGTGPADTGDPSGRMIPPAGGAPSMGYPALAPGPANVAPSPAPQATINPETDKSAINAPLPPPRPKDLGANPNAPSRDAQPVSSPAIPSNPAGNSRGIVTIDAPNQDPNARGGARQMGAADLSHLWGPNPPLAQAAPTPPPAPPVRPPNMDDVQAGIDMGYAKGGAIPSRATAFAAAGPVSTAYPSYTPAAPAPQPGLTGNPLAAAEYMNSLPGMTQVDLHSPIRGYYTAYGPGSINMPGGVQLLQNYGRLTPDQKSQYDAMVAGTWTPPADAPAPAPTPAAPAPAPIITPPSVQNITNYPAATTITDPTTQTSTGAPKLPNSIQAKSYDPNVDNATGATFKNTSSAGGTDYSVGNDDLLKTNDAGDISGVTDPNSIVGAAKGGAIPARPTTGFATGGSAISAMNSPGYVGPTLQGGWQGTPMDQLAPNQQTWATTTQNLLAQQAALGKADAAYWGGGGKNPEGVNGNSMQYWSQLTAMPDAIWPTAAPAAPTPVPQPPPAASTIVAPSVSQTITDPTATTTTGAPGLPNSIQAKSYDPNVDQQTGAGFANTSNAGGTDYSVGADDLLQQTSPGNISGTNQNNTTILSKRGGPIPKVTQRVKFDDGGGVNPSAIGGMPPGLGGGAQQAPPPIYFNPATYAPAGAPVGKGISQSSAPTTAAGAIPSLPMARGGVVGYADGGGVGDDDLSTMQSLDVADARDEQATAPAAAPAPQNTPSGEVDPSQYLQMASATPAAPAAAPTSGGGPRTNPTPPDPTTAEIHDGNGNPSKGLISAIGDGLHWLGDHLGLTGGQAAPAIAAHPEQQQRQQQFINNSPDGATYMSPQNAEELKKIADPDGSLSNAYRNIAGLEAGYKWALSQGDTQTAGRLAAAMLHYSVVTSQNLSAEASKALYNGDIHKAVDYVNQASDAIPDGRLIHMELNPDGKTVTVTGSNLDGQALWQKQGAAAEILERATSMGKSGKLQWDALESQAAKYDSTFAQMQKARQGNATGAAKQMAADKASAAEAAVLKGMARPRTPPAGNPVGNSPAIPPSPTGAPTTAATAGAPPSPNGAGSAQPNTPPQTADSGYQPSDLGGEPPAGPAIPSAPTAPPTAAPTSVGQADMPAPLAEPVDSGPAPPTRPDEVEGYTALPPAQQNEVWKTYNAQLKDYTDQRNAARGDARMDRREQFSQDQQNRREQFTQQSAAQREKDQRDFQTQKEQDARQWDLTKPRDPREVSAAFSTAPNESGVVSGKEPTTYMAEAMGYKKPDGTVDTDMLNKNFTPDEQNYVGQAMVNAYHYSPGTTAPMVTKAILGSLTDPNYVMHRTPISEDKTYGVPRYAITVEHKGTGTSTSFVMPVEDYNNLKALYTQRQAAAQKAANPPAPAGPPVRPFPASPMRAPSPTTGQGPPTTRPGMLTGAPPPASNPVQDWWHRMNNPPPMARGRGALPPGP